MIRKRNIVKVNKIAKRFIPAQMWQPFATRMLAVV